MWTTSNKKEDAINTYILLKDGRAFENQEALRTTFQVWLPLVRYPKYNRMVAHEATIKRKNKKPKKRIDYVVTELKKKQKNIKK